MSKLLWLGVILVVLTNSAWAAVIPEDAEKFDDEFSLQPYVSLGFGGSKFLVGTAKNSSTGEVKDVHLSPAGADALGVKLKYTLAPVLDLIGGFGYNSAREDQTVKSAEAKFSWINVSGSVVGNTPYSLILRRLVRWHGGLGVDYYSSPELSISGWASVSGKYASKLGYHALVGIEIRDQKAFSVSIDARYRMAKVAATTMSLNGVSTYDVIGPDGTLLRTMNLTAFELALGLNWHF
ncbi:MAG: hypothetical protein AABY83_08705 [Pseudomonadota bacterium]